MRTAKRIAKYKIYLDRSRTYVSYVQLAMVMKLFLSDINLNDNRILLAGLAVCFVALIVIGYLDTRFGIRAREMENNAVENPFYLELMDRIKSIEKCVK